MVEEFDEIPPGDPFQVLLFQLPKDESKHTHIQDTFFLDGSFWQPYVARMLLWTRPYALTKTETPDGDPALALLVPFTDFEQILFEVGREIAESLEIPAFALTLTFLDDAMKEDLNDSPRPWESSASTVQ